MWCGGVEIEISNDRDQLSKEEIDLLIQEAEASRVEDNIIKEHSEARNGLNNLAYSLCKNILRDQSILSKFNERDQKTFKNIVMTTADWLGDLEDEVDMSIKEKVQEIKDIEQYRIKLMIVAQPLLDQLNIVMSSTGDITKVLELPNHSFNGWKSGPNGVIVENVDG